MEKNIYKNFKSNNLPGIFFEQAKILREAPVFWSKKDGFWEGITWEETAKQVNKLAVLLKSYGAQKGDRIIIACENRPEWAIADLAIMLIGAIVVPAYTLNTEEDNLYLINHSKAKIAITSGGETASRLCLAANISNNLNYIILIDSNPQDHEVKGCKNVSWSEELKKVDYFSELDAMIKNISIEDTCCCIYTSNTFGKPKGVMLTHKSIISNILAFNNVIEDIEFDEKIFLSVLPLSNAYEHTCGLHWPIHMGAEIYYSESIESLDKNIQDIRPTLMIAVPKIYEVLYSKILNEIKAKGGVLDKLFLLAVRLGQKKLSKIPLLPHEWILDKVVEKLVRSKVKMILGGRLKYFISGGVASNPDIVSFLLALGVGILHGYGQTETSPLISINRPDKIKVDTLGPPVLGVEIKIDKFGELLVKGDLVMKGYWNDKITTNETIKDGWLYTGDLGEIDEEQHIKIKGRKIKL